MIMPANDVPPIYIYIYCLFIYIYIYIQRIFLEKQCVYWCSIDNFQSETMQFANCSQNSVFI